VIKHKYIRINDSFDRMVGLTLFHQIIRFLPSFEDAYKKIDDALFYELLDILAPIKSMVREENETRTT